MMSWPRARLIVVSTALAVIGAAALVLFRAFVSDELHWFYFLLAMLLGVGVGMATDLTRGVWPGVAAAMVAAWVCGVAGYLSIALLEWSAIAVEFDRRALNRPDYFIALEAYKLSEAKQATPRPFSQVARRQDYDDATWQAATAAWNERSESEKESIKRDRVSQYQQLNLIEASKLAMVLFALPFLIVYAIGSMIAGGAVVACARDRSRKAE